MLKIHICTAVHQSNTNICSNKKPKSFVSPNNFILKFWTFKVFAFFVNDRFKYFCGFNLIFAAQPFNCGTNLNHRCVLFQYDLQN